MAVPDVRAEAAMVEATRELGKVLAGGEPEERLGARGCGSWRRSRGKEAGDGNRV